MLILIILGAVALLSMLFLILGRTVWDFYGEFIGLLAAVLACCVVAIAISGGVAISIQAHTEEDYINALNEKATIEYFISQSDDDILRDKSLYNRVVEFNNRITYSKYRADSLWVGIWVNKKIGTIDYSRQYFHAFELDTWKEELSGKRVLLILSSVLHEVDSATRLAIVDFAEKHADTVVIRDMYFLMHAVGLWKERTKRRKYLPIIIRHFLIRTNGDFFAIFTEIRPIGGCSRFISFF